VWQLRKGDTLLTVTLNIIDVAINSLIMIFVMVRIAREFRRKYFFIHSFHCFYTLSCPLEFQGCNLKGRDRSVEVEAGVGVAAAAIGSMVQ
jgi:hypothetical protein